GREGRPHQGRRLPHDRCHRPRLPGRHGGRRAHGRGRGGGRAGRCGVTAGDNHLLRNVTREVLAELLPGLLEEALTAPATASGNGHHAAATAAEPAAVPQVPAPPVAAVHRPPGWRPAEGAAPAAETGPAQPSPAPPAEDGSLELGHLRSDADLDAFVRSLARRLENPRDRMAILSGRLRFGLGASVPVETRASTAG